MKLQAVKDDATDQNFREIKGKFPVQPGDIADSVKELFFLLEDVTWGISSINIASQGGYATITHGHGKQPEVVIPVINSGTFQINVSADEYKATTFRLGAYRTDGPNVGTQNVAWIAIG